MQKPSGDMELNRLLSFNTMTFCELRQCTWQLAQNSRGHTGSPFGGFHGMMGADSEESQVPAEVCGVCHAGFLAKSLLPGSHCCFRGSSPQCPSSTRDGNSVSQPLHLALSTRDWVPPPFPDAGTAHLREVKPNLQEFLENLGNRQIYFVFLTAKALASSFLVSTRKRR